MVDLSIYTFNLIAGKENPDMPGLYTALPPRHTARGRERDLLVLSLRTDNGVQLGDLLPKDIIEKVVNAYYATRGTVTAAIKSMVEQLNDRMLARNLRGGRETSPVIGILNAAVIHDEMVYLAHVGPTHSFVLSRDSVQDYHDPFTPTKGLGISRSIAIRYYRNQFIPGDLILFCSQPPRSWTAASLSGSPQVGFDGLRRRLLNQVGTDLQFCLLRASAGKGDIRMSRLLAKEVSETGRPSEVPARSTGTEASQPAQRIPPSEEVKKEGVFLTGDRLAQPKPVEQRRPEKAADKPEEKRPNKPVIELPIRGVVAGLFARKEAAPKDQQPLPAQDEKPPVVENQPEPQRTDLPVGPQQLKIDSPAGSKPWQPENGQPIFEPEPVEEDPDLSEISAEEEKRIPPRSKRMNRPLNAPVWLATAYQTVQRVTGKWSDALKRSLPRMLPGQAKDGQVVTPQMMVFIAVAVPLIVVAVAMTVYFRNGRGEQQLTYLSQAQAEIALAQQQEDPTLRRINWENALTWLDKANQFGQTEEVQQLRAQVRKEIDTMDGIRRLGLQLGLVGGFDRSVNVTQAVSTLSEDVYVLDSNQGRVIRLVYTRQGYEVDTQFTCGPGQMGAMVVGKLVDLYPLTPGNQFEASVMAVDEFGNLLFCSQSKGVSALTLTPPDAGWGSITAITYDQNVLYVLDKVGNAVWRYDGVDFNFFNAPHLFFDKDIPNLSNAIDLAVYQDDLFVLHSDGHMTMCSFSSFDFSPTRCNDPYPYKKSMGSDQVNEIDRIDGVYFTHMQATQPPEPSLFMLDENSKSIYHFSLVLNLQKRMLPDLESVSGLSANQPLSAYTVTPNRNLVLIFGTQVYTAELPAQ